MKKVFENIIEELEKAKVGRGLSGDWHNGKRSGIQQAIEIVKENAEDPEISFDLGSSYEETTFFTKEMVDNLKKRFPSGGITMGTGAGKSHWVEDLFKKGNEVIQAKEKLKQSAEEYTPEYIDHINRLGIAGAKAGKTMRDALINLRRVVGNYREKYDQEVDYLKRYFMAKYAFYNNFRRGDVTVFIQAVISTTHLTQKNNSRFIDLSDNERNLILARVALDYNFIVQDLQSRKEDLEEVNHELRVDEGRLLERCHDLEEKIYQMETDPNESDMLKLEIKSLQNKVEHLQIMRRDKDIVVSQLRAKNARQSNEIHFYYTESFRLKRDNEELIAINTKLENYKSKITSLDRFFGCS